LAEIDVHARLMDDVESATSMRTDGFPAEAEATLTHVLEQSLDFELALSQRADLYAFLGRFDEAIAGYDRALELCQGRKLEVLVPRARCRDATGDLRGACLDLDDVLIRDPEFVLGYVMRGTMRTHLKDAADALVDLDATVAK